MQPKYRHTQKGGLPFYFILILFAAVSIMTVTSGEPPVGVIILIVCIMFWTILMMSSLTVEIDDEFIRIRFGPGVFFKKFRLSNINEIGPKYTTFVLGWGIRWYITGWLYNIAGFKSVEIILKDGQKRRIGTDEPEKLAEAIQDAISQTPKAAV